MVSALTDLEKENNAWLSQNVQLDYNARSFILNLGLILRL